MTEAELKTKKFRMFETKRNLTPLSRWQYENIWQKNQIKGDIEVHGYFFKSFMQFQIVIKKKTALFPSLLTTGVDFNYQL